ncbi:MAG: tyrosine--tRNA ligase [Candidatus Micrarchaeia archaeon]
MDVDEKIKVIKSFAAEVVTEEELRQLFETKEHPVAYDGFEPSGPAGMHFGVMRAKNINRMLGIGIKFKLYIADYFAFMNNKLGGDLEHIRNAGKYFIEVWKAAGVDTSKVEIIWNSELMKDFKYWDRFIKIGRIFPLDRTKRAITIMGRKEGDAISTAQIFYPIMQATDIFEMDIDICQLGLDQRKANMLAREAAQKFGWKVPVVVSHPLLLGLRGAPPSVKGEKDESVLMQFKMSKSDPKNSISVHDSKEQIYEKIGRAYCPEKIADGNPMIDFVEKIIIDSKEEPITIDRPSKFGGPIEAANFGEMVRLYTEGKIHPLDLKNFVAEKIEEKIRPIREHFEKDAYASKLYSEIKSYSVTR